MSLVEAGSSARRRLEAAIGFFEEEREGKRRLVRDLLIDWFRRRRSSAAAAAAPLPEGESEPPPRTWEVAARGGHRECVLVFVSALLRRRLVWEWEEAATGRESGRACPSRSEKRKKGKTLE